jgi:hypothetical protein
MCFRNWVLDGKMLVVYWENKNVWPVYSHGYRTTSFHRTGGLKKMLILSRISMAYQKIASDLLKSSIKHDWVPNNTIIKYTGDNLDMKWY